MLQGNKRKMLIITSLCCLLVFMGVGYAILSTQLNLIGSAELSGIWDIRIVDMKILSKTGMAKEGTYSYDGLKAEFSHTLYAPGDSVEYEITIENKGNIKASLNQITSTVTPEYNDLILTNSLTQGQTLEGGTLSNSTNTIEGGGKITFTIKSEFDIQATKLPDSVIAPKYEIEILFYQHEGNEIVTPPDMEADNVCFTVSADGELTDYDYAKCGSTMTVPNSVDGVNVTKISNAVFDGKKYNDYIKSLGYVRYKEANKLTHNGVYFYYTFFETQEDMQKYLDYKGIDVLEEMTYGSRIFEVVDFDNIKNHKVIIPDYVSLIDDNGDMVETAEECDHVVYEFYFGNDVYFLVDSEKSVEITKVYAELYWEVSPENVFVIGDSNIPFEYEFQLSECAEDIQENLYYDVVNSKHHAYFGKTIIDTLDLSNSNHLTKIDFDNVDVNRLYLPNSLITISSMAFNNSNLTYVTIPSSVIEIGSYAFSGMKSGSVIKVDRSKTGMTLGNQWSGSATVKYSK